MRGRGRDGDEDRWGWDGMGTGWDGMGTGWGRISEGEMHVHMMLDDSTSAEITTNFLSFSTADPCCWLVPRSNGE